MKKSIQRLFSILVCVLFCIASPAGNISAAEQTSKVQLPTDRSIVFYLNNTTQRPYTKIANKVDILWVGEHHRFTVAANRRESVSVSWTSSKPEVAEIDAVTGELTALAVGKTKITMKDSKNNAKASFTLTVKPETVLPEIPEEWYTVREERYIGDEIAVLCLKPEYRYLYEQCTMLQIPTEINGREVYLSTEGVEHWRFNAKEAGFTNLKLLSCGAEASYIAASNEGMAEMLIPKGVKYFLRSGFYSLGQISYLHLPEGIEIASACYHSTNLKQVRIPASLQSVEYYFDWDVQYRRVFAPQLEFSVDGNNKNYYSLFGKLFEYPKQTEYDYTQEHWTEIPSTLISYVDQEGCETYYVPEGVEKIGKGAFYKTSYLRKVILPDSVKVIATDAFNEWTNLEEIYIPASVTYLGAGSDHTVFGHFEDVEYSNLTIVTPKGSAAEVFAIEYNFKYRNE